MASDVQIANRALRRIGANPILAFDDPTPEGQIVNDTYTLIRDDLLRDHPWNFASKRTSLAASATAPDWGYDRAFPIPDDYLRLLEVNGQSDYAIKVEQMSGNRVFVTDLEAPLKILYVAQVTDPEQFDGGFLEALVKKCAMEWAEPLTATTSVLESVTREYADALSRAKASDGQEGSPDQFVITTWTNARV